MKTNSVFKDYGILSSFSLGIAGKNQNGPIIRRFEIIIEIIDHDVCSRSSRKQDAADLIINIYSNVLKHLETADYSANCIHFTVYLELVIHYIAGYFIRNNLID